jgi:RNA polymerase sigma-70 factor (ECF subfamily)
VLELCRRYLLRVASAELDPQLQGKLGASDVVQETLLEAQRIFDRFQGDSPAELRAWLRAILLNKVATHTRHYRDTAKRQVGQEVGFDPDSDRLAELAAMISTPSSLIVQKERAMALTQAVQRLPEHYRQIIVWRQVDNLSFEEMASRLGRSVEAVRKLWWRAIQQLQQELGDSL